MQSVKVDTQAPQISGSLEGTPGTNGWYISNVTLNAAANDGTSGIETFTYTQDGAAAVPYTTPLTLTDGIHSVLLYAEDEAGLSDSLSQAIKVDTLPPALDVLSVLPEWNQDTVTLNGTASDPATGSGLLKVEVSTDNGATWHTATGSSIWSYAWDTHTATDGAHTLRVRSIDYAELSTQSAFIAQVDNSAPHIELPADWNIWDTVGFDAWDHDSGLAGAEIVISDPQGRWPKRTLMIEPDQLPLGLLWDRRFGDGTIAPFGDYDVDAWATNRLGINTHQTAIIHISLVGSWLPAPGTATPLPSAQPSATPTYSAAPATLTPTPTGGLPAVSVFGTPGSPATPTATTEPNLRATPTAESFTSWLASVFLPPAPNESVTEVDGGPDPQPSPAAGDPNLLYDAAAIAAVAGVTAYWAQKKKEEEEARQAAEAQRRLEAQAAAAAALAADPHAAEAAAARRRRTARARRMGPLEAAAEKLKQAIAAVTQKEQKEWKAERYEQISQTDGYKNSNNKTQFMKQELENIKEQEAAYREKEKKEAEAAAELPPPPPPLPPMPDGLSPEAQAAWLHSPAAAQWAAANTAALQAQYAAELAAQKRAQQVIPPPDEQEQASPVEQWLMDRMVQAGRADPLTKDMFAWMINSGINDQERNPDMVARSSGMWDGIHALENGVKAWADVAKMGQETRDFTWNALTQGKWGDVGKGLLSQIAENATVAGTLAYGTVSGLFSISEGIRTLPQHAIQSLAALGGAVIDRWQGKDRGWDIVAHTSDFSNDLMAGYYLAKPTGLVDQANRDLAARLETARFEAARDQILQNIEPRPSRADLSLPRQHHASDQLLSEDGLLISTDGSRFNTDDIVISPRTNESKYLWVIDQDKNLRVAWESTYVPTDRLNTVHSNLVGGADARLAGEVWFTEENKVILNGDSGRYGPRSLAEMDAASNYWKAMGYDVESMGWDSLRNQPIREPFAPRLIDELPEFKLPENLGNLLKAIWEQNHVK